MGRLPLVRMQLSRLQEGFTIIELVTVIMVLGILSVGTTRFLNDASNGYASTVNRAELAGDTRSAISRMLREVREALPNSIRVSASGDCLEYIPVTGGSIYLSAPIGVSATSLMAVPLDSALINTSSRIAVSPQSTPYSLTTGSAVSPVITVNAPNASNEVRIDFAAAHQFPRESAQQRFYVVGNPVSYCISGDTLWRYTNYGFLASQPGVATLPASTPNRTMLAQSVSNTLPHFIVSGASLSRNAMVEIDIEFANRGDLVRISQLVHMRNLP